MEVFFVSFGKKNGSGVCFNEDAVPVSIAFHSSPCTGTEVACFMGAEVLPENL
jgi:hypothetical protein